MGFDEGVDWPRVNLMEHEVGFAKVGDHNWKECRTCEKDYRAKLPCHWVIGADTIRTGHCSHE